MKSTVKRAMTLLAAATLGTMALNAQLNRGAMAEVPFAFEASGETMPSGTYKVTKLMNGSFRVENSASGKAIFLTLPGRTSKSTRDSEVSFRCYGEGCSIAAVKISGDSVTYTQPAGRAEGRIAAGRPAAVVSIALR